MLEVKCQESERADHISNYHVPKGGYHFFEIITVVMLSWQVGLHNHVHQVHRTQDYGRQVS